jgi:hypothetical protein
MSLYRLDCLTLGPYALFLACMPSSSPPSVCLYIDLTALLFPICLACWPQYLPLCPKTFLLLIFVLTLGLYTVLSFGPLCLVLGLSFFLLACSSFPSLLFLPYGMCVFSPLLACMSWGWITLRAAGRQWLWRIRDFLHTSEFILWSPPPPPGIPYMESLLFGIFLSSIHRKKMFSIFPSPAGMSLTKLSLGGNNDVIYKLFPPRESLV